MNIHKSQLFWCKLQGYKVLTTGPGIIIGFDTLPFKNVPFSWLHRHVWWHRGNWGKKDFQHHVIHQPSVVQLCFVGWRLYLHLYQLYYFSIPMIHPDNPRIGSRENWQVSRGGKKNPWFGLTISFDGKSCFDAKQLSSARNPVLSLYSGWLRTGFPFCIVMMPNMLEKKTLTNYQQPII